MSCRSLFWCSPEGHVARISFRAITMHAMSEDTNVYKHPCIYCQIDSAGDIDELLEGSSLGSNEVFLVPQDHRDGALFFELLVLNMHGLGTQAPHWCLNIALASV